MKLENTRDQIALSDLVNILREETNHYEVISRNQEDQIKWIWKNARNKKDAKEWIKVELGW